MRTDGRNARRCAMKLITLPSSLPPPLPPSLPPSLLDRAHHHLPHRGGMVGSLRRASRREYGRPAR